MKILKYEKKKNGMYQVFFDNGNNIDLHEQIILKYDLLIKKEANDKEISAMLDENKKYIYYNLAIKYISTKMRSKKEIKEYLLKNNADINTVNEVIDILIKENYLNDLLYSKAFVNDHILLSNDGPNKIRMKLNELGVEEIDISDSLSEFTPILQKERIERIAKKQLAINRNKSANALKNKIMDYLYNLGYDKSIIIEVVSNLSFKDDSDLAKKEYEKIYKKLSRKYSGNELELRVRQKMYDLGFKNLE